MGVDASQTEAGPKGQSPTFRNIVEGRAKITHAGGFVQSRTVGGRDFIGTSHQYEVTLPKPDKPEETWTTYLTRWDPAPLEPKPFERRPEPQLFITTGQGEMPFSNDPEVVNKVFDEISRQMEEQRKEAKS